MTSNTTTRRKRGRLMISLSLIALSLGACNKRADQLTQPATAPPLAALPLATAEPPAFNPAPLANQLPWPARPIRVAQRPRYDRYAYVDDAYDMSYAFADAPPDYAFDYDGIEPWAWRADDGAYRIVEWLPYGERVYYYEPDSYYPFFISDPDYSYAYDDEQLIGIYDPYGYPLDYGYLGDRAYNATRYFSRGRDLYRAAIYQPRRSAYAEDWLGRRDYLRGQRQRWEQGQSRDPDWRGWRSRHQADEGRWRPERDRRMSYAMASAAGWGAVRDRMERRGRDRGAQQQWAGFGDRRGFDGRGQPQLAQGWQRNAGFGPQDLRSRGFGDGQPRPHRVAGDGFFQRQQAIAEQGRRGGWQHGQPVTMAPLRQTRDGRFAGNGFFRQRQTAFQDQHHGGPDFRTNQQLWQQAERLGGERRFGGERFVQQRQALQERQRGGWQRAMEERMVQRQQQDQQRGGWQRAMQERFVQRQQQEQQRGGWQQAMQARAQAQQQRQAQRNDFAVRFAQAGGAHDRGGGGGGNGGGGNGGGGDSGNPWGGHHGHH
jgi:hypothetical protein